MVWMLLSLSYFWFVLRAMKLCFNLLIMAITMLIIHPQYPHCHAPIYQLHFITIPRSMHGRHPHPSSPSPFLSLTTIPIPHPYAWNLVYLAAHHARVQLISTGTPKVARLHAWDPCMQAAPPLTFSLHTLRQQGACSPHLRRYRLSWSLPLSAARRRPRRLHQQRALQGPGRPCDPHHSTTAFVPPAAKGSVRRCYPGGGVDGGGMGALGLPMLALYLGLS